MSARRTIAVVTGSRAEFGLLATVMRAIRAHRKLRLRVIVAGWHWAAGTWSDVEAAGFAIDAKVRMQQAGRTGRAADAAALGRGVSGFASVFSRLRPDLVLVLGDRIEPLAAAAAAAVAGIPVAHLHGGDRAEGVADESMRHAISKLAHLHLAATPQSRRRLIRMGEDAARVWNIGSPAMDELRGVKGDPLAPPVLVLQHPVGAADEQERLWMRATLAATRDYDRLVMSPNGDAGRRGILRAVADERITPIDHLPRPRWLRLLAGARVLVGNSSAGLIEAAGLRLPVVNIGPRQGGRERPDNVVDCGYGEANIARAMSKAMRLDRRALSHPYGDGRAGRRTADLLARVALDADLIRKRNTY